MFSTLVFVVKDKGLFALNIEFHSINTHHKLHLHVPIVNLSKVQKGVYYSSIKLFNSLPLSIKQVAHDLNKFKQKLKKFLILNSFYSVEEYLIGIINLSQGFPSNYCLYLGWSLFYMYIVIMFVLMLTIPVSCVDLDGSVNEGKNNDNDNNKNNNNNLLQLKSSYGCSVGIVCLRTKDHRVTIILLSYI
jgi:hypothetical protein